MACTPIVNPGLNSDFIRHSAAGCNPLSEGRRRYADNLDTIQSVIDFVAGRLGFTRDEREDFRPEVHIRLLENQAAILEKYRGECRLRTFLVTVVTRLGLDYRRKCWGKWRPSRAARRLGNTAIRLESLICRDRRSRGEAVEILRSHHRVSETRSQLEALAGQIPVRVRPRVEGEEAIPDGRSADPTPEAALLESEARQELILALDAVRGAINGLAPEERLILRLFFMDGFSWKAVGEALGFAPRRLYTIKNRTLAALRDHLEAAGVSRSAILKSLGKSGFGEIAQMAKCGEGIL